MVLPLAQQLHRYIAVELGQYQIVYSLAFLSKQQIELLDQVQQHLSHCLYDILSYLLHHLSRFPHSPLSALLVVMLRRLVHEYVSLQITLEVQFPSEKTSCVPISYVVSSQKRDDGHDEVTEMVVASRYVP